MSEKQGSPVTNVSDVGLWCKSRKAKLSIRHTKAGYKVSASTRFFINKSSGRKESKRSCRVGPLLPVVLGEVIDEINNLLGWKIEDD